MGVSCVGKGQVTPWRPLGACRPGRGCGPGITRRGTSQAEGRRGKVCRGHPRCPLMARPGGRPQVVGTRFCRAHVVPGH